MTASPALPAPSLLLTWRACVTPGCNLRASVASPRGLCEQCNDRPLTEQVIDAAKRVKLCMFCGELVYKDGRCHYHFREYHRQYAQQRKAATRHA